MRFAVSVLAVAGCTIAHGDYPAPPSAPVQGATHIAIAYTFRSFVSAERNYVVTWDPRVGYVAGDHAIDLGVVEAIYAALTELVPSADELACSSHSDDAPSFDIAIDGAKPIEISSSSNCHLHVPWNVTEGERHFVQYNGQLGHAVAALLAAVDPDAWHDRALATTATGGELIKRGSYRVGQPSPPAPTACAHSIETNADARESFGEDIKIDELDLACDLSVSADCQTDGATAWFDWNGVGLEFEFACTGGRAEFSSALAGEVAELRRFLDSKPAHALVELTKVQLRPAGKPSALSTGWVLAPRDSSLPMLELAPGSDVITARIIGERGPAGVAFFTALGLDPAPLTHPRGTLFETSATLDFDGHLTE